MNTQLLIIDPQNDFIDQPGAKLPVRGAQKDAQRLSQFMTRHQDQFERIHVTLDTHQLFDVAHPMMWVDDCQRHPQPFTIIHKDEVERGRWRASNPNHQKRLEKYVEQLYQKNRNPLCIWPPHCLIGEWGHNVVKPIFESIRQWEQGRLQRANFVLKGMNPWTEHYSAIQADVPDQNDPTTQLNRTLLADLKEADQIFVSGQALSHCVANTVRDIADNMEPESIEKIILIENTTSPVPGFENMADSFLYDMKKRGMQTIQADTMDI